MNRRQPFGQAGVGLIEIMVALVVVSLLTIVMITVFLSSRASFLTQEQVGRMQESGRYAWHLIAAEIQRAGYRREPWDPPKLGFAFTANTADGGGKSPDVIELQYETDRDCFSDYNSVTEDLLQPDGVSKLTVPRYYQKVIRFSVDNDQLLYRCSYGPPNGTLTQQIDNPVADGIENLQIQYGEDLTRDFSVNRWVDAGDWNNFSNVVSVRVAVLARTPEEFTTEADQETFDLYGVTIDPAGDNRIRRVYPGQISVRNLTL